jgi:hypothetical protein
VKIEKIRQLEFDELYNTDLLYKYVDWSDEVKQRILTHFEIHFTSPDEFGNNENPSFQIDFNSVTDEQIINRAKELLFNSEQTDLSEDKKKIIINNYRDTLKNGTKNIRKKGKMD